MGKSLNGGGVDYTIRAPTDQLQSDLAKAEGMVKQSAQRIRGTANTSIAGVADLGKTVADKQFDSNVQARIARMQENSARDQLANREKTAARNLLGITLPSERREMARFAEEQRRKEVAGRLSYNRDTASFQDFISDRNRTLAQRMAGALSMSEPDLESGGAMDARRVANVNRAARFAELASRARLGLGIAGGAAAAAMFVDGGLLAQQRAYRDAGERFSFQDRNRFNDATIRASAGAMAMGEHPMNRLLSILPRFADEIERAAHSAAQVAEAHRIATTTLQDAAARTASITGRPMEAFRIGQARELSDARANFDTARRAAFDLQASGQTFGERMGFVPDNSASRQGAANRTARESSRAYYALEEAQKKEAERQSAMSNAERYGLGEDLRASRYSGASMLAELRGDSIGSFAARRKAESMAIDQQFRSRLASVTGDQLATDRIKGQWDQAKVNFGIESKLQLRSMASDNTGTFMSTSEGARFATANRMQFAMENANLETGLNATLGRLSEVLDNLSGALSRTPLLGQPN